MHYNYLRVFLCVYNELCTATKSGYDREKEVLERRIACFGRVNFRAGVICARGRTDYPGSRRHTSRTKDCESNDV